MERIFIRSGLPLRHTQGFNPRPIMSLSCPRPVGVTSRQDLLLVSLDQPLDDSHAAQVLERLNRQAPRGLAFLRGCRVEGGMPHHPRRMTYELPLAQERAQRVRQRIGELDAAGAWPAQRRSGEGRDARCRELDLKQLVEALTVEGGTLRMRLRPQGDLWARPAEVLGLVGLDERSDLAHVVRTEVDYE